MAVIVGKSIDELKHMVKTLRDEFDKNTNREVEVLITTIKRIISAKEAIARGRQALASVRGMTRNNMMSHNELIRRR